MTDGLKIETAAGIVARDMVSKFFQQFALVIVKERLASQAVTAAFVDGLSGSVALTIQGRHGSKSEVIEATISELRKAIERDLNHLKPR